jgi:flavin reductase (DIM6/NTAB) family NADH-FMN oxidoreductase RutF
MIEVSRYKQVMSRFPCGVSVVTVSDGAGGITGLTASSFTSVSLEPPLILFCVGYQADSFPHLDREHRFAVNLLAQDQAALAWQFAGREPDKGVGSPHLVRASGTPVLTGVAAVIECEKHRVHEGGDHAIVVGRVLALDLDETARPLVLWRGEVGGFEDLVAPSTPESDGQARS